MERNIMQIKSEIVHQILLCELGFNICSSIKIIPGRGFDFLPYYYNLNFTKGILSLHSLLLSQERDELSIKNYISEYKEKFPGKDIKDFEDKILQISDSFKKLSPEPLRHKIAAHLDEGYSHAGFTSGYMMPQLIPEFLGLISQLKDVYFGFCNYSKTDYPFGNIKKQSDEILKIIK